MRGYINEKQNSIQSSDNTAYIFYLALLMMPFENLVFAPSRGWATVTPIIFILYVFVNLRCLRKAISQNKGIIFFVLIYVLISIGNMFFVVPSMHRIIDSGISLGLGLTTYFSFYIWCIIKKPDWPKAERILLIAYTISLVYGWVAYAAYQLHFDSILAVLRSTQLRNWYLREGRIAFTFTEPSFISMHLYGVLLLFHWATNSKRIRNLIVIFVASAVLLSGSVRFLIDTAVIMLLIFISRMSIKRPRTIILFLCILSLLFVGFQSVYSNNRRIQNLVDKGVYGDDSSAARYFRTNAILKGIQKDPIHALFGYGLGNALVPLLAGYDEARAEYKSSFTIAIINLRYSDNMTYITADLYTLLISEIGIIPSIIFICGVVVLARRRKFPVRYLIIIAYLYAQWGSLTFYSLWILLVFMRCWRYEKYQHSAAMSISKHSARQIITEKTPQGHRLC
jgi:hypothetical protein